MQALPCSPPLFPLPRILTRLLDHPEALGLPWHEVLEPCLSYLNGPSSDFEVLTWPLGETPTIWAVLEGTTHSLEWVLAHSLGMA